MSAKGYGLGTAPFGSSVGAGLVLLYFDAAGACDGAFGEPGMIHALTQNGPGDVTIDFTAASLVSKPQAFFCQMSQSQLPPVFSDAPVGLAGTPPVAGGAWALRVTIEPALGAISFVQIQRFIHGAPLEFTAPPAP